MMQAIIVDDEQNARNELEYLLKEIGGVEILDKCPNALEGIKSINKHHPDLLFLDIHLPAIDGFEMLSMIEKSVLPRVIFVTAFDEFAVKAFENNAMDYILKPVEVKRLKAAVEKVADSISNNQSNDINISALKKIPTYGVHKIKLVDVEQIEFVQTDETGIFFINDGKKCFTDLTLKAIEERTKFFRCHKQYLINIEKIDEIIFNENSSGKIITKNKFSVPVSRHYLKSLKETLGI